MADTDGNNFIEDAFPPRFREVFVERGNLLGCTVNYNDNSTRGIRVHLHFSIVNHDGAGNYTNELDINNIKDPSPYLGKAVHCGCASLVPGCSLGPSCG